MKDGVDLIFIEDPLNQRQVINRSMHNIDAAAQLEQVERIDPCLIPLQADHLRALLYQGTGHVKACESCGARDKGVAAGPEGRIGDCHVCCFRRSHPASPDSHMRLNSSRSLYVSRHFQKPGCR